MKTTTLPMSLGIAGRWTPPPARHGKPPAAAPPNAARLAELRSEWFRETLRNEPPGLAERVIGWTLGAAAAGALGWLALSGWQIVAAIRGLGAWVSASTGV